MAHILLFPPITPCRLAIRRIPCSPFSPWCCWHCSGEEEPLELPAHPPCHLLHTNLVCSSCLGLCGKDGKSCCWILLSTPPNICHGSVPEQLGWDMQERSMELLGQGAQLGWSCPNCACSYGSSAFFPSQDTVFLQGLPAPFFCPQGSGNSFFLQFSG